MCAAEGRGVAAGALGCCAGERCIGKRYGHRRRRAVRAQSGRDRHDGRRPDNPRTRRGEAQQLRGWPESGERRRTSARQGPQRAGEHAARTALLRRSGRAAPPPAVRARCPRGAGWTQGDPGQGAGRRSQAAVWQGARLPHWGCAEPPALPDCAGDPTPDDAGGSPAGIGQARMVSARPRLRRVQRAQEARCGFPSPLESMDSRSSSVRCGILYMLSLLSRQLAPHLPKGPPDRRLHRTQRQSQQPREVVSGIVCK